jgi:hypothetical protein
MQQNGYVMRIVMPQSSLVRVAFPKLQFGISPPENSAYDRVGIDRYVLRKGRVCRMVTILHFGNVSLRGLGHGGIPTRGTKHYIYLHIATFSLYIIIHANKTESTLPLCSGYTEWTLWLILALSFPFSTLASGSALLHPDLG